MAYKSKYTEASKNRSKEKYDLLKDIGKENTPWQQVPENWNEYEAFVYCISNKETDKRYIGYKNFWVKSKGKITKESDWRTYRSSSLALVRDIASLGIDSFLFEIMSVHRTTWQARQEEASQQFKADVLTALLPSGEPAYYNDNIMSKFFRPKDFGTPEYEERINNISAALRAGYSSGRIVHGMLGKQHPNKGKKLPQTGHKKNTNLICYNNGKVNKRFPKGTKPPRGFVKGMLVFNPRKRKEKIIPTKTCPWCNEEFTPKGTQKYCSTEHTKLAKAERTRERYAERTKDKVDGRKKKV